LPAVASGRFLFAFVLGRSRFRFWRPSTSLDSLSIGHPSLFVISHFSEVSDCHPYSREGDFLSNPANASLIMGRAMSTVIRQRATRGMARPLDDVRVGPRMRLRRF
jgi:hypothetical protein